MKQIMKKTAAGVIAAVLVLSVGATSALAAGSGCGRRFSDSDGDGICDYAGSACRCTDMDNDGICDNCGICQNNVAFPNGFGQNYVDANGDGVCDNYTARQGTRQGRGCREGHGR